MSNNKKFFQETEIVSALVGLLLNFTLIALLIGLFWYLYTISAENFLGGFVEIARTNGSSF